MGKRKTPTIDVIIDPIPIVKTAIGKRLVELERDRLALIMKAQGLQKEALAAEHDVSAIAGAIQELHDWTDRLDKVVKEIDNKD